MRILIENLRYFGHRQAYWLFTKRSLRVKLGATKNKSNEQQGKELNSGPQEYKSSTQPIGHNVPNNADKIHVNVTFTIIFHIYFKIQGVVK